MELQRLCVSICLSLNLRVYLFVSNCVCKIVSNFMYVIVFVEV